MSARSTPVVAVVAVIAAAAVIGAVQSRDTGGAVPQTRVLFGTAVLTGTLVTDSAPPEPVRRAVVHLAGAPGTSTRVAGTDDAGRFVFTALPAGRYTLSATKPGYVTAFHGSKRPGRGPGVPVAIDDGQRADVTLQITRGAVITGTITDMRGRPASMITITAVEMRPAGVSAAPPARATTDDLGVFRIYGLAPGEYVISAVPRISFGRGSMSTADILGVTDAEAQWARSARSVAGAPMPPAGRPVTYAPVFYPGTTNAVAAGKVSVEAGEERTNVGFALQIVPTARIAGSLVDHTGQPVGEASVSLHPRRSALPSVGDALVASGALVLPRAAMTGTGFSIAGVTPGEYTLVARTGSMGRRTAAAVAAAGQPTLWNVTDVRVDGQDHDGLVLRLQPGAAISGTIVFDRTSLAPPADLSRIDLTMRAVHSLVGAPAAPRATVSVDGTFRFASVVPGTYAVNGATPLATTPERWTLKSAMLNGRDIADALLEVAPGQDVSGLVITFTDRAPEIAGRLVDAGGRPVTRYSIVVITTDRSHWLPGSRRIRSVTPATNGSFGIAGLPPGEYAMAAIEDLDAVDLYDQVFLSQLIASAAYKFTLADGEKKHQDLRVGR